MQNNLKVFAALAILTTGAGCTYADDAEGSSGEDILLYCDLDSTEPVEFVMDDGEKTEGTLSYSGFYRIDIDAQTIDVQYSASDDFSPLCHQEGACKLVSNKFEIRFENYGREYDGKVINETYVLDRITGGLYMKTDVFGEGEEPSTYARGSCRPIESTETTLF